MTIGNTYVLFTGACTGKKVVTRLVTLITGIHNSIARKEITLSMSKPHTQFQNSKILSLLFLALVMREILLATRGLVMEGLARQEQVIPNSNPNPQPHNTSN